MRHLVTPLFSVFTRKAEPVNRVGLFFLFLPV
jgi:hypothetical protein